MSSSAAAAYAVNPALLQWALRETLGSLPARRDWLNPDAEKVLRAVMESGLAVLFEGGADTPEFRRLLADVCESSEGSDLRLPERRAALIRNIEVYAAGKSLSAQQDAYSAAEAIARRYVGDAAGEGGDCSACMIADEIRVLNRSSTGAEPAVVPVADAHDASEDRLLFEAAMPPNHPRDRNMPDGSYNSPFLHPAWFGWQAYAEVVRRTGTYPAPHDHAAFEAAMPEQHMRDRNIPDGSYNSPFLHTAWYGWQSHACLAIHMAAQKPTVNTPEFLRLMEGYREGTVAYRKVLAHLTSLITAASTDADALLDKAARIARGYIGCDTIAERILALKSKPVL